MAESEAPRIKLCGPPKAPPVELLRWLLESRGIAFEAVSPARGETPLIVAPAGEVRGLREALLWLDELLAAREALFRAPGERDYVLGLCAGLAVGGDAAAALATVEADLGDGPFLGGASPDTRDIAFAALATPWLGADPGRPAALLAKRVWALRPPVRDHGKVPADRPGMFAELKVKLWRVGMRLLAAIGPRALLLRGTLLVPRWADVDEALRRDGDFLIAPVNAARIEGVMGPFILGMDASPRLHAQREATYAALRDADKGGLKAILAEEPARLAGEAARRFGRIDVVNGYARLVAARVAASLFGVDGPNEQDLMRTARAIFHETFLNLGDDPAIRAAGRAAGKEMMGWIEAEVTRRGSGYGDDVVGRLAAMAGAGTLPPEEIPWITAGLLVGAIDTTATAVAHIVAEAVRDDALRAAMRRDRGDHGRLTGWCWEALRRRPHNPAVLRQAGAATSLAGRAVPAGTKVLAMTLAAMQDRRVFPDPARLDPGRPRDLYLHFGHALHRCSGRGVNELQIPTLVGVLLDHGLSGPAESRSRGPFPDRLVVSLERRA